MPSDAPSRIWSARSFRFVTGLWQNPAGVRTRIGLGTVVLAAGGCFSRPAYECTDHGQCVVGGVEGVCELDGLCSYFDESCPSGRRYSPYAGDKAETCVDEDGGNSGPGSSSTMPSGSATAVSTSAGPGPGPTTDPITSTTDDPSSTGCTDSCAEPGDVLWSIRDDSLGDAGAQGIAVAGDALVVTGWLGTQILFARYARDDGASLGSAPLASTAGGPDIGYAIAEAGSGDVVVAGAETTEAGATRGAVIRVAADNTVQWKRLYGSAEDDAFRGVALDDVGRVYAVGFSGTRAVVMPYEPNGTAGDVRVFPPGPEEDARRFDAVASTAGGGLVLAGATEQGGNSTPLLVRTTPDGAIVLEQLFDAGPANAAFAAGTTVDAASLGAGRLADAAWIARIDATGSTDYARELDGGAVVQALATTDVGDVVVAGYTDAPGNRDIWVAKLDSTGVEVWSQVIDDTGDNDEAYAVAVDDGTVYVAGQAAAAVWIAALEL